MVQRDIVLPSGNRLVWQTEGQIREWRRKVRADLTNSDGRRIRYQGSESTDKGIPSVDRDDGGNPLPFEKPAAQAPRSARETVELMTQVMAQHMLKLRRFDPEAFRAKIAQLRAETGNEYAHWTDEQLGDRVVEVCRVAVTEPLVQRVVERHKVGGGWRGAVLE